MVYPNDIREPLTGNEIRSIMNQDIVFVLRQEMVSSIFEVLANSGKKFSLLDFYKRFGLGDAIWCDEQSTKLLPNMFADVECKRKRYPIDIKF